MRTSLPVIEDHTLPDIMEALDARKMAGHFGRGIPEEYFESGEYRLESCEPEYVRYKPGVSCVVGYRLGLSEKGSGSEIIQRVHGRFVPSGDGEEEYRKARKTHTAAPHWGPSVAYLRDIEMVVSFFPNDRVLRGLRFVLEPDKLKRIAQRRLASLVTEPWWVRGRRTRIEMLSYKPERHCVVRYHLGMKNVETGENREIRVIGKILRREHGEYIYNINRKVRDLCGGEIDTVPLVPEPVAFDPDLSFFFQEEIVGTHPFPGECPGGEWHSLLGHISRRLKAFHKLDLTGLRPYSNDETYKDLCLSVQNAVSVLPEKKEAMTAVLGSLEGEVSRLRDRPGSPTHGDFHLEQIVLRQGEPVILDLDSVKMADPIMDVANFSAHLLKLELDGSLSRKEIDEAERAIISAYFEGEGFDQMRLPYMWHRKAALMRLALSCLKYLPSNWTEQFEFFLKESARSPI